MLILTVDDFTSGVRAYQERRFKEAFDAFCLAEKAEGDNASCELLYNKALAAIRAGKPKAAESAAEMVVSRGGEKYIKIRDFIFGDTAYLRCLNVEALADMPESMPALYDHAIHHARTAMSFWKMALMGKPDWPEARRNLERVMLKLNELKKKKEEAEKRKKKKIKQPDPKLDPELSDPENPDKIEEEVKVEPVLDELPPELVKRLFDKLNEKEKEKRKMRRELKKQKKYEVEKDW